MIHLTKNETEITFLNKIIARKIPGNIGGYCPAVQLTCTQRNFYLWIHIYLFHIVKISHTFPPYSTACQHLFKLFVQAVKLFSLALFDVGRIGIAYRQLQNNTVCVALFVTGIQSRYWQPSRHTATKPNTHVTGRVDRQTCVYLFVISILYNVLSINNEYLLLKVFILLY